MDVVTNNVVEANSRGNRNNKRSFFKLFLKLFCTTIILLITLWWIYKYSKREWLLAGDLKKVQLTLSPSTDTHSKYKNKIKYKIKQKCIRTGKTLLNGTAKNCKKGKDRIQLKNMQLGCILQLLTEH